MTNAPASSTLTKTVTGYGRATAASLAQVEAISGFALTITVKGRVDGDLLLEFELNDEYKSYGKEVKGNDLQDVIDEFKRRHGWQREHQPLMIAAA